MASPPSGVETPCTVLPKIRVTPPIISRLSPHVASRLSMIRPQRWRMMSRSTSTPKRTTVSGARTSIEIQSGTPALWVMMVM